MEDRVPSVSPQLAAANRRLLARRARLKRQQQETADADRPVGNGAPVPPWAASAEPTGSDGAITSAAARLATLPAHLGWGSTALTAALRRRQGLDGEEEGADEVWLAALAAKEAAQPAGTPPAKVEESTEDPAAGPEKAWVKLYPDIGLGMLRQELTAPGRVWLLLRYLDEAGRGWLRIDITQQHLASSTSTFRLCGKRQLRNLLRDGEGIFWTRSGGRIWLRSAAKVAHALGVTRLTGRPVALPRRALLEGIGAFRAHLYAAFHSGRVKDTPRGSKAMPISRDALAAISGVGATTQRTYEDRTDVDVEANFAVGEPVSDEARQERAWRQGRALFEIKDYRGQQGKKGRTYLAWQLPNSYLGAHSQRPKGRQKRINRELKDLVMQGMPGNVEQTSETPPSPKVYYPNGKQAAKVASRAPDRELYWRRHRTRNGRFHVWQQMGGEVC